MFWGDLEDKSARGRSVEISPDKPSTLLPLSFEIFWGKIE
jgi:hypothetical protein